ncbi:hypothetical protein [uncultured Enterovirga sp.]|uniref:hypothetical protein n=1 Tax=uncultured Enterovirga sp. TaxID=2026352 RepID=UPI0035CAD0E1
MASLSKSNVLRAGVTAAYWSPGTSKISVSGSKLGVSANFIIASKGGGRTQIKVNINPEDFEHIVTEMMKSDPAKALKAMSTAIAEYHS